MIHRVWPSASVSILAGNTHTFVTGWILLWGLFFLSSTFPKKLATKHFHHRKIQIHCEKERREPISRRRDISWWFQSQDVLGKNHPGRSWCVSMAALPLCFFPANELLMLKLIFCVETLPSGRILQHTVPNLVLINSYPIIIIIVIMGFFLFPREQ